MITSLNLGAGTADSLILQGVGNTITGISGVETITGGTGADALTYAASATLQGNTTSATIDLGGGADTITLADSTTNSASLTAVETITTAGNTTNESLTIANASSGITSLNLGAGTADALILANFTNTISGITGVETITGGTGADTLTLSGAGTTGTTITGGQGGDVLTLASAAGTDIIRYTATNEGAAAGANTGQDTVTNFQVGTDKVSFTSAAGFDDVTGDNLLTAFTSAAAAAGQTVDLTTDEGWVRTGLADADLTEAGFTTLLADINANITLTSNATGGNAANDALFIAVGATKTAYFAFTEAGTAAAAATGTFTATDLTLLSVVDGQHTTTDVTFVA